MEDRPIRISKVVNHRPVLNTRASKSAMVTRTSDRTDTSLYGCSTHPGCRVDVMHSASGFAVGGRKMLPTLIRRQFESEVIGLFVNKTDVFYTLTVTNRK